MTRTDLPPVARQLRAGDLVEVRSEAEILAMVDDRGTLDGLPVHAGDASQLRQVVHRREQNGHDLLLRQNARHGRQRAPHRCAV